MKKNHIAVVTRGESDLLDVMRTGGNPVTVMKPEDVTKADWEQFDAIAILGGTLDKPILFTPEQRTPIEEQMAKGKRVFSEFTASIGYVYSEQPSNTRYQRLVFCSEDTQIEGLSVGMLLDDQAGTRIKPHDITCVHTTPILQYTTIHAHDKIELTPAFHEKIGDRALWFEAQGNLLVCSFRLSNFVKARFAPKQRFAAVIEFILNWLFDTDQKLQNIAYVYSGGAFDPAKDLDSQVAECAAKAVNWMSNSSILCDNGKAGLLEGFATEINADGVQKMNVIRRADCMGEASLSYFLSHLLNDNADHLEISDNLMNYIFNYYICKESGDLQGMMRWTDEAWGVCYQDDVARAIIPQMLKNLYTGSTYKMDDIHMVLSFLVNTTGSDGTRVFRTDNKDMSPEQLQKLRSEPGNLPSAHYNAFYYAALCLAYHIGGDQSFLHAARKGMDAIMAVYPETTREQSETQEYCRLILPLSWIYWVTGDSKYKNWLYQVTQDLQAHKHHSGAYLEWDTGYKADMRNEVGEGESSLLAENGDPVVDLLYSNNWLPMAFIQAYFVTEDEYFLELWNETAVFMINSQLQSSDLKIHGGWARAFDVEKNEVFGSPADAGWGPWAIESGWTVAEIASGLMMGLMKDQLKTYHKTKALA
ncbi:hypothetical protein [Paenibacillus dakarensis]|uniref:hypothetical protein n=1 Tax=Paenibacillus dakarensis TaxID=1527293 RepID=UPI0006D5394A|nr:hypothetical protein [Paenibacillus dakarensis]